ncbi:MAG: methyltransferase domain-containing protein [Actinobacteria bacterium]|nr:methyltransferase domain-containing protein [Actinomycetota bacterium]
MGIGHLGDHFTEPLTVTSSGTAKLEDFSDPGLFDYVVSSLTLHHIQDVTAAADKIPSILTPQGGLILVEFAWDRFDDATARWALDRLPENFRTEDRIVVAAAVAPFSPSGSRSRLLTGPS